MVHANLWIPKPRPSYLIKLVMSRCAFNVSAWGNRGNSYLWSGNPPMEMQYSATPAYHAHQIAHLTP